MFDYFNPIILIAFIVYTILIIIYIIGTKDKKVIIGYLMTLACFVIYLYLDYITTHTRKAQYCNGVTCPVQFYNDRNRF